MVFFDLLFFQHIITSEGKCLYHDCLQLVLAKLSERFTITPKQWWIFLFVVFALQSTHICDKLDTTVDLCAYLPKNSTVSSLSGIVFLVPGMFLSVYTVVRSILIPCKHNFEFTTLFDHASMIFIISVCAELWHIPHNVTQMFSLILFDTL